MYSEKQGIFASMVSGKGRLNRLAYFGRNVLLAVIFFFIFIICYFIDEGTGPVTKAAGVLFIIPEYFLNLQRMHDIGKYLWLAPLSAILNVISTVFMDFSTMDSPNAVAILALVIGLYMLFWKGQEGENEYGPDPLAKP